MSIKNLRGGNNDTITGIRVNKPHTVPTDVNAARAAMEARFDEEAEREAFAIRGHRSMTPARASKHKIQG